MIHPNQFQNPVPKPQTNPMTSNTTEKIDVNIVEPPKKPNFKRRLLLSAIIFGVALALLIGWHFHYKREKKLREASKEKKQVENGEEKQDEGSAEKVDTRAMLALAKNLRNNGFKMLGVTQCGWTKHQRDAFGERGTESRKALEDIYVECHTMDMCPGVQGYPTWQHEPSGQMFPGFRDADGLNTLLAEAKNLPKKSKQELPEPEKPKIEIIDDGEGMDEKEAEESENTAAIETQIANDIAESKGRVQRAKAALKRINGKRPLLMAQDKAPELPVIDEDIQGGDMIVDYEIDDCSCSDHEEMEEETGSTGLPYGDIDLMNEAVDIEQPGEVEEKVEELEQIVEEPVETKTAATRLRRRNATVNATTKKISSKNTSTTKKTPRAEKMRGVSVFPPLNVPVMPGTAPLDIASTGMSYEQDQERQGNFPRESADDMIASPSIINQLQASFAAIAESQKRSNESSLFADANLPQSVTISTGNPMEDKSVLN